MLSLGRHKQLLASDDRVHAPQIKIDAREELLLIVELDPIFEHTERFRLQNLGKVEVAEFVFLDYSKSFFVFGTLAKGTTVA